MTAKQYGAERYKISQRIDTYICGLKEAIKTYDLQQSCDRAIVPDSKSNNEKNINNIVSDLLEIQIDSVKLPAIVDTIRKAARHNKNFDLCLLAAKKVKELLLDRKVISVYDDLEAQMMRDAEDDIRLLDVAS